MMIGDVRLWPKAEMSLCTAHVRFWGQSGHGFLREVAFVVLSGAKRTYLFARHMSAFDPKRTSGAASNLPIRACKMLVLGPRADK